MFGWDCRSPLVTKRRRNLNHECIFERFPHCLPVRNSPPDIPEDIYLIIFDHIIQPKRIPFHGNTGPDLRTWYHLSNLTLVCRFFAKVFMPILLRSKTIDIRLPPWSMITWMSDTLRRKKAGSFSRALLLNNSWALAQMRHVKECTITRSEDIIHRPKVADYLIRVSGKLPFTLESLFLSFLPITSKFFVVSNALTNLTSLALYEVSISSPLVLPPNSTFNLTFLSFFFVTVIGPSSVKAVMNRLYAFLYSDSLRTLHTNHPTFVGAFADHSYPPRLDELVFDGLTCDFASSLLLHLSKIPSLKTLIINRPYSRPKMGELLKGRVWDPDSPTASVEVLHIPVLVYFECAHMLGDVFPRLNVLSLRFDFRESLDESDTFVRRMSALGDVRSIHTLSITRLYITFPRPMDESKWFFELASQAKAITSLLPAFPSLLWIQLAPEGDQGWTWRLQRGSEHTSKSVWKPSVGTATRKRILNAFQHLPIQWYPTSDMDFDGTFATLFPLPPYRPHLPIELTVKSACL